MGIVILNNGGGPGGLALGLFILGIIICVIGLFFVRNNEYSYDEEDDDDEGDNDNEE